MLPRHLPSYHCRGKCPKTGKLLRSDPIDERAGYPSCARLNCQTTIAGTAAENATSTPANKPNPPTANKGGNNAPASASSKLTIKMTAATIKMASDLRWARREGAAHAADSPALPVKVNGPGLAVVIQVVGRIERLQQERPLLAVEFWRPAEITQVVSPGCLAALLRRHILQAGQGIGPGILPAAAGRRIKASPASSGAYKRAPAG